MKPPIKFNDDIMIREPIKSDAQAMIEFFNPIIAEKGIGLVMDKPVTLKDEQEYLNKKLKTIKEKKGVALVAVKGREIVGFTDIDLKPYKQKHIGEFGISVAKNYRDIGLGSFLMNKVIELAKERLETLEIVKLGVFADNKRAIHVYEKKLRFKRVAMLPGSFKQDGKRVDEIVMYKEV